MAANIVGKSGVRKSAVSRTSLGNPYTSAWPTVKQNVYYAIMNALRRDFPTVLSQKSISKAKRKQLLESAPESMTEADRILKEQMKEKQDVRSCMVVGINEVTRGLEKDQLALVLVCRSVKPSLMTDHLLLLGATRQIPIVGLHDLGDVLGTLLSCKKVGAIGFKKQRNIPVFDSLIEFIIAKVPQIVIPWLNPFVDKSDDNTTTESKESEETKTAGISDETPTKTEKSSEDIKPEGLKRKLIDTSENVETVSDVSAPKKMKCEEKTNERMEYDGEAKDNLKTEDSNLSSSNVSFEKQNKKGRNKNKKGKKNENQEIVVEKDPLLDAVGISCKPPVFNTVETVRGNKKEGKKKKRKAE